MATLAQVKALRQYADPVASKLADWNWKPLNEVAEKIGATNIPDYIQKGYGEFMKEQAAKAASGALTPRDFLKAYTTTQSSIGRGGLSYDTATKTGLKLPRTGTEVRPEGAYAEWLKSKAGQDYLNDAQNGIVNQNALNDIRTKFAPFGKQNQLTKQMEYGVQNAPRFSQGMNAAVTGTPDEYRDWAEGIKGIAGAKSGFIGSMLGRGDLPTFDARQIGLHTTTPPVGMNSIMQRGKGEGARQSVDRLAARQQAMGLQGLDPSMDPFYQHLTHHAVWDKVGDTQTTHQDIIDAMRNYAGGGTVESLAKLGKTAFEKLGLTQDAVDAWRKVNSIGQRQVNNPMTKQAAIDLGNKAITPEQYRAVVREHLPIHPFTEVPPMPSHVEMASALKPNQVDTGIVGVNKDIPDGMRVSSRLDIPAYNAYDKWIVSLHDPADAGKSLGYGQTAHLTGPIQFTAPPKAAHAIATGKSDKTTYARIHGDWNNTAPEDVHAMAQQYLNDPEWAQLGNNPYRHSYFYDKADMSPVTGADEVVQVGPLLLAKNPFKAHPDDPQFKLNPKDPESPTYKSGGLAHLR